MYKNWKRVLNRYITNIDIKKAINRKFSASLIIRKLKVKTMSYHYTYTGEVKLKRLKLFSCFQGSSKASGHISVMFGETWETLVCPDI